MSIVSAPFRRCLGACVLGLLAASAAHAAAPPARTLHALDIDRIGPEALAVLRADPGVRLFVELGDRAVVEATPGFVAGQRTAGRWRASVTLAADQELRVHRKVHCDPDERDAGVDALGALDRWHVSVAAVAEPLREGQTRLERSAVLGWQGANRVLPKIDEDPALSGIAAAVDATRWRATVAALSSHDRQTGAGFSAALLEVMDGFSTLGLAPRRECFDSPHAHLNQGGRNCNVVAEQRGVDDDWVIVGAHLDSRNAGFDDAQRSPGAEDNASGCAGVLEVARVLRARRPQASILYQCYGLEEQGLFGSRAHAESVEPARVRAVLNLDMIAFDGDGRLDASIETYAAHRPLLDRLAPLAARYTLLDAQFGIQTCCSDHVPYLQRGIPAVLMIENDWGQYPQYHTAHDTAGRLSDAMGRELVKLAAVGAAAIAGAADAAYDAAGYWYDPALSGQGWHFEALPGGRAAATWYTFDAAGARLWLVASGTLDPASGARLDAFVTNGGRFPGSAGAATAASAAWGELRFRFQDCAHGTVEWTPRPEIGLAPGSASVQRLTPAGSGACAAR